MTDKMIEVKTFELSGAALDWAVAMAEGYRADPEDQSALWSPNGDVVTISVRSLAGGFGFSPSTNWSQGGPLIDKYQIDWWVCGLEDDGAEMIEAYTPINAGFGYSTSRLIAACRAIVASKFGDTVSIPRELLP